MESKIIAYRINIFLFLSLFALGLCSCSSSSDQPSTSTAALCEQGLPRACAKEYKNLSANGDATRAEQTYKSLCQMPRISCYQVKPDEPVSSESQIYEKLVEQDVWRSGRITAKRVVLYRTIDVSPDHLKPPKK